MEKSSKFDFIKLFYSMSLLKMNGTTYTVYLYDLHDYYNFYDFYDFGEMGDIIQLTIGLTRNTF
tara:strand:+ start:187 stop:378 length:192 start_codon:yes stop_codon:yes gene_type:complete